MSTSPPPHQPWQPVIRCLPPDAAAVVRLLARTSVERERPGSADDRYLDHLIGKPWGLEFRVYDDALIDVWMLQLKARTRTSMHCHPRKDTFLLGVAGRGTMTTGDARRHPIKPGTVLHIEQGAAHRTTAATDLVLVEIETPRDKYDLVRFEDDNGRASRMYEHAGYVTRRLDPLEAVREAPPRARLRPRCPAGLRRFQVERGDEVERYLDELDFAISLDPLGVLRRDIAIATPDDAGAIRTDNTYLTIRSTNKERSA